MGLLGREKKFDNIFIRFDSVTDGQTDRQTTASTALRHSIAR